MTPAAESSEQTIPAAPTGAGVRVPPPLIYVLAFAAGVALQLVLRVPGVDGVAAAGAGAVLCVAGGGLAGSSVVLFRRAGTHLDPSQPATALVTSGPYRLTRNPIYLGFTLLYAGIALLTGMTGALVTLPAAVVVVDRYVIRLEERYLDVVFGDAYGDYRASVRRWL